MENNIKVFNEYNIGDIVVSLNNKPSYRKIGDMFIILERSTPFTLYYAPYTSSGIFKDWRAATEVEIDAYNNGIKNIKDIPNFNDNGEMTNDELLEKAITWVDDDFNKGLFLELINKAKNIKLW